MQWFTFSLSPLSFQYILLTDKNKRNGIRKSRKSKPPAMVRIFLRLYLTQQRSMSKLHCKLQGKKCCHEIYHIYILQDLQAQPPARSCYVLLALFREITTSFSHANVADGIPARVGFGLLLLLQLYTLLLLIF